MTDITFSATFGDLQKQVRITAPLGAGLVYHVYIDNFYAGQIIQVEGKWTMQTTEKAGLTVDDVQAIVERIAEG